MTLSPPAARPTTVIVTAAGATQDQLVGCLRSLLRTAPSRARVAAAIPGGAALPRDVARRVRMLSVVGADATAAIATEVAKAQQVVVLPAGSSASASGWLPAAQLRWDAQPGLTGVVPGRGADAFFFPEGVTRVDGPQVLWTPLAGLAIAGSAREVVEQVVGARPAPTISAVLIVKDEERVLERCLAAVSGFVDDVVVYDTGSTDATRQVAAAAGATVVEGYWDDDFGAARNRAIAHSRSDWVFIVDADEVVVGSREDLRAHLKLPGIDAIRIEQLSTAYESALQGESVMTTRVFRRDAARYEGALHEQVVPLPGRPPLRTQASTLDVRLLHSGYRVDAVTEKDKQRRNADIARAALEAAVPGSASRAELVAGFGRSLAMAGESDAALEVLTELLDAPAGPGNMVQAGRVAVPVLLSRAPRPGSADAEAFERWLTALKECGESPGQITLWRAGAAVARGDTTTARSLLESVERPASGGRDLWDIPFDAGAARVLLAALDTADGHDEAAAARMRGELDRAPETVPLQALFDALGKVGWTVRDLVREAPAAFRERALREMQLVDPVVALHWFAEHCALDPDDPRPMVAGCTVAARSDWRTALEWSLTARERGLPGLCPLGDLADDERRAPHERALALALLAEGFGDTDSLRRLVDLLEDLPATTTTAVLELLLEQVPSVLERLASASALTAP